MHMNDALVTPTVGVTMYALSGIAATYCIYKLRKDEDLNKKIPTMGVMGAFVFATQMVNFSIPGTGSSGHLCGGLLLSSILGPYAGFLSMIGVLMIQAVFFSDGGLLALGANVWNMAFYGCFIGTMIWKLVTRKGMSKPRIIIASLLGSTITLLLGAFSVTIETLLSNITELPFIAFISAMIPIHLAIGIVEGIITSVVLLFINEARPELLLNNENTSKKGKFSYHHTIALLLCLGIVIGGGLSLLASSSPDGLEWSIQKLTGSTEITSDISNTTSQIQEKTAILPDYSFKNSDSTLGTSTSGIVGGMITIVCLCGVGTVLKVVRKKKHNE